MGIDDTTLIEVVEPSSFVAAGDRFPVHLNSSYSTASIGDILVTKKKVLMFLWRSQNEWREAQQPRKRKLNIFCSKPGLISEISGSGECISGVKYPRLQVVRLK